MYKKILSIISVLMLAILASGCVKYSTTIEITKKDEVVINQVSGISTKLLKTFDPNFDIEDPYKSIKEDKKAVEKYKEKGYKVENFKNEDYIGKQLTRTFKNAKYISPDALPDGFVIPSTATHPIVIKKNPFGTSYSINIKFDPKKLEKENKNVLPQGQNTPQPQMQNMQTTQEENSQQKQQATDLTDFTGSIMGIPKPSMDLKIKIPKKAYEHNATSVDEKTHEYIWDFSEMMASGKKEPVEIILKYKKTNFLSIIFLILIICATLRIVSENKQYSEKPTDENMSAF